MLTFPEDERIDEPYRGRRLTVNYEIRIEASGTAISSIYVGDREIKGYTAQWVIDAVRNGKSIDELAENIVENRRTDSQWPADSQWR